MFTSNGHTRGSAWWDKLLKFTVASGRQICHTHKSLTVACSYILGGAKNVPNFAERRVYFMEKNFFVRNCKAVCPITNL